MYIWAKRRKQNETKHTHLFLIKRLKDLLICFFKPVSLRTLARKRF